CATVNNDPAADVVCSVPSGNLNPPVVDSITPATVSLDVGVSVPIPTAPNLSSKIVELPINELLLVNPVHFVRRPRVPPPMTARFRPAAMGVVLLLAFTTRLNGLHHVVVLHARSDQRVDEVSVYRGANQFITRSRRLRTEDPVLSDAACAG